MQELQYPTISITLSSTFAPAARAHTHDSERIEASNCLASNCLASNCLSHPSATDTRSLTPSLACSASASADVYTQALSRSEAQAKLDVSFYPFLDAGYITDYTAAFRTAASSKKPLFAVVLWGALDDASC